jgi:hypothetical protein
MREITLENHKRRSDQLGEITGDQEERRRRRGWWRWEASSVPLHGFLRGFQCHLDWRRI